MATAASGSASLSSRLPDVGRLTTLVESLTSQVKGVKVPEMPTDRIGTLAKGLKFDLPNPDRWKGAATADASRIAVSLPDPRALIAPLEKGVETAREIGSLDFGAEIEALRKRLEALGVDLEKDPKAFVQAIFAPTSPVAELIRESPFMRLILAIGRLIGGNDIDKVPEQALALAAFVQQVIQDRVGALLLAFVAAGEAATLTSRIARAAELMERSAGTAGDDVDAARQRVLDAYRSAATALASVSGTDGAAARTALVDARTALAAYVAAATRALAFGEASASLLGIPDARARYARLGPTLERVDRNQLGEVASAFESLVGKASSGMGTGKPTAMDEVDKALRDALDDLRKRIDAFDVSQVEQGIESFIHTLTLPLDKLEEFKTDVEREVRSALETIRDAVASVNLKPVRAEFDKAMGEVDGTIRKVSDEVTGARQTVQDAVDVAAKALNEARDFLLDPDHGLKHQIDLLFGELHDLLKALDIHKTVDGIQSAVNAVAAKLDEIQLSPVIDATVTAIEAVAQIIDTVAPLLVTDSLREKLSEATAVLRKVDFDAIRSALQEVLDTIIEGVNTEALGKVSAEYNKVVAAVAQLDPGPVLEQVQKEVFDPLIEELQKIKPADTLAPLADAFKEGVSTLQGFDPAASLQFLVDFHHDISARFESMSPDKLLEPVQKTLSDIRDAAKQALRLHQIHAALDALEQAMAPIVAATDVSGWLTRLDDGLVQVRAMIEKFDPAVLVGPLAGILRDAFDQTGAVLDRYGLAALFEALAGSSQPLVTKLVTAEETVKKAAARVATVDVDGTATALRAIHGEMSASLGGATLSVELKGELGELHASLAPTPALAALSSRGARAQQALAAAPGDIAGVRTDATPVLAHAQEVIDALRVLRRPLTNVRELLLRPVRTVVTLPADAGLRDILLAGFDALNPVRWRKEIDAVATSLAAKLRVLTGASVIAALKAAVEKVSTLIDGLNIDTLVAALREIHDVIAADIAALDPAPLLATLRESYGRVLATVMALDPAPFIKEIDDLYNRDVIGTVKAISPVELLLPPLKALFKEISDMLGALDISKLFAPVLDELRRLREELLEGIGRAGDAYGDLLKAIPTGGGGASASASVSVG